MAQGIAASANVLQSYCLGVLLLLTSTLHAHLCISGDTLSLGRSLTGSQTITSDNGVFELGYFYLGSPSRYYIGIWYKEVPDEMRGWYGWPTETGLYKIAQQSSRSQMMADSGNLVMIHGNFYESIVWDSFGQPTTTFLPGGRLELNKATKQNMVLTSWKNMEDSSLGPSS
ncbi:G-type lectin S-receptor-like serine/threonine-protein kinase At2g19130 [Nymphaea colorata]|nr:G-type lectin S-receptor-like serine/threonine-protein kinase At2g19130 [Nymphaea colorata]